MELYTTFHPVVFLWSLLCGAVLYCIYEMLRLIRYIFRQKKTVVFFCDIFFMLFSALIIFYFSLGYNFGQPRIYMLFAICTSFLLLRFTIGKIFTGIFAFTSDKIRTCIIKIYRFFQKVISKLLKSTLCLVYNLINKIRILFNFIKGRENG